MKNLVLAAALAAFSLGAVEAKPLKLLAIGNSYTFSLCEYLGDVAAQNGCELEYCLMCIGGCSLERHVRVAEAADASPTNAPYQVASNMAAFKGVKHSSIQKILPAEPWDVVVIQQASPYSWRPESYEPWGDKLIARIRALAPQAKIMVQKTWSYNELSRSLGHWKLTRDEMYARLSSAYDAFAGKRGLEIIPSGTAVQLYRQRAGVDAPLKDIVGRFINTGKMPDDVRKADTIHLSKAGQYLQANVWVAKLFGSDLAKSEMKKDIAGKYDNALLRACALDAVRGPKPWRPKVRWCGFNLLGLFCKDRLEAGNPRVRGYFPEEHFRWMHDWGFNFARLPLDYRLITEPGDWNRTVEAQLRKLDEAIRLGERYGIHVQINLHRAPGFCCNKPVEPKSLFLDPEPLMAFTNLWGALARRYHGIPNERLSFDLLNEPGPVEPYGCTSSNYAVVARAAIAAIRAEDSDRFIMSDGWFGGNRPTKELRPFDAAMGESVHCYTRHDVTHFGINGIQPGEVCPPWPPEGGDGAKWLEERYVKAFWQPAIDDGTFLFMGEFGCYQKGPPHATYLRWLEDVLKVCRHHGWGWALWNLDGEFGIVDTGRTDCTFEDFEGHNLDRKALDLLLKYR